MEIRFLCEFKHSQVPSLLSSASLFALNLIEYLEKLNFVIHDGLNAALQSKAYMIDEPGWSSSSCPILIRFSFLPLPYVGSEACEL